MPYEPRQKDPKLMKLKLDIDNAYLEIFHNDSKTDPPKINIEYSNFGLVEDFNIEIE